MSGHPQPSQHPIDLRIREIVDPWTPWNPGDIDALVNHVARASFSAKRWSMPAEMRVDFHGMRIGTSAESALYHALKRIIHDRQWAESTLLTDYLSDISATVRPHDTKIAVFRRWNQTTVAFLAETKDIVPVYRQGTASLPFILVLYSADTGKINTSYMVSSETAARIAGHARWLR